LISYNNAKRRIADRFAAGEKIFTVHNLLEVLVEPLFRTLAMAPI
jgi:hypothetical protein